MVYCSAFGCKSRSKKEPGITFHRFPRDPDRRSLWVRISKNGRWSPTTDQRICSKHFEENCFYQVGNAKRLLIEAVPTIFPELPNYLQPEKSERRSSKSRQSIASEGSATARSTIPKVKEESPSEKRLRYKLFLVVSKSREKSKTLKVLGQKLRRYKERVVILKRIIKDLQELLNKPQDNK